MKFYLSKYDVKYDLDHPYIEIRYSIHDNPGFLDLTLNNDSSKPPIEIILKGLCNLYKQGEITLFYRNMMYKTYNGYYQEYKRF